MIHKLSFSRFTTSAGPVTSGLVLRDFFGATTGGFVFNCGKIQVGATETQNYQNVNISFHMTKKLVSVL